MTASSLTGVHFVLVYLFCKNLNWFLYTKFNFTSSSFCSFIFAIYWYRRSISLLKLSAYLNNFYDTFVISVYYITIVSISLSFYSCLSCFPNCLSNSLILLSLKSIYFFNIFNLSLSYPATYFSWSLVAVAIC